MPLYDLENTTVTMNLRTGVDTVDGLKLYTKIGFVWEKWENLDA